MRELRRALRANEQAPFRRVATQLAILDASVGSTRKTEAPTDMQIPVTVPIPHHPGQAAHAGECSIVIGIVGVLIGT